MIFFDDIFWCNVVNTNFTESCSKGPINNKHVCSGKALVPLGTNP